MSFTLSGSGHTSTDEDFEAVRDAVQEAANNIGAHTDGSFTLTLTGNHNNEPFSETYTSQDAVETPEVTADPTAEPTNADNDEAQPEA